MMKKLYFCKTNGYNMLVSVDNEKNCRYLTETIDFPYLVNEDEQQKQIAIDFLNTVEDDSSWEDDCTYDQIFSNDIEIIAETEKYL